MRTLRGWIAGAVFGALAVAHADEPVTFETEVSCDIEAGHYEVYQSAIIDKFALGRTGAISGALMLDETHLHEKWRSQISLLAQNKRGETSEISLGVCADKKRYCPYWRALRIGKTPDGGRKASELSATDFGRPQQIQGVWTSFRLEFVGPRQWTVQIGPDRISIILPPDITALQVECIGLRGRVRFDLNEKLS